MAVRSSETRQTVTRKVTPFIFAVTTVQTRAMLTEIKINFTVRAGKVVRTDAVIATVVIETGCVVEA